MAEEADSEYTDTIEVHGREFQRYSYENGIYYVPVDEVSYLFSLVCFVSCCPALIASLHPCRVMECERSPAVISGGREQA